MSPRIDRPRILELAEKHVKAGKIKDAIAEYEKLVAADPQDIGTLNAIADLHIQLDQTGEAVRYLLRLAEEYERRGLVSQALAFYKKIHKIGPELHEHALKLADMLGQQGFLAESKSVSLGVARRFLEAGQAAEAIGIFEKVTRMDGEDLEARKALAGLYRDAGFLDAAVQQLNEIAEIRLSQGRLESAEEVLTEALALKPGDTRGLVNTVELFKRQGRTEKAVRLLEECLAEAPDNIPLLNILGNLFFEEGEFKKAEDLFSRIVASHPLNVNARVKLGRIFIVKDKLDQAFELFEPLVNNLVKKRREDKAVGLLSLILEAQKPHLPALERLAQIYRSSGETKKLEAVTRAMLDEFRKQGARDRMLAALGELRQLRPDDAEAAEELRHLRKDMGFPEEEAPGENPNLPEADREIIRETLDQADFYTQQGLVRNARRILENLLFKYPDEMRIRNKIGVLDEIKTHIDEEELRRRVERTSALDSRIKEKSAERRSVDKQRGYGPFSSEVVEGEKVSTAEIFAETDIVPFAGAEPGERTYYDLRDQAGAELRMLRTVYLQQSQGEMASLEKELSGIVSDFRRDLKTKVKADDSATFYHLGVAFMGQGLHREAIEEFSKAAKDSRYAIESASLISLCLRHQRDFEEAEKWLRKALELAEEGSDQYYALEFELAELWEQAEARDKAMTLYREIRDWNPGYRNISDKLKTFGVGPQDI
ncbi:MAG: tetratricopeptide repeat protein [Candidatus Aminicenantes bacterium]|nr:tetratricopeptide repeat protein [Candidatus Aminicenantes bacterium]